MSISFARSSHERPTDFCGGISRRSIRKSNLLKGALLLLAINGAIPHVTQYAKADPVREAPGRLDPELVLGDKEKCKSFALLYSNTKRDPLEVTWMQSPAWRSDASRALERTARAPSAVDANISFQFRKTPNARLPSMPQTFSLSIVDTSSTVWMPGPQRSLPRECRRDTSDREWCVLDEEFLMKEYSLAGISGIRAKAGDGTEYEVGNMYHVYKVGDGQLAISIAPFSETIHKYRFGLMLKDAALFLKEDSNTFINYACVFVIP